MKYFITGGAGFIGSHLVDRLLADGDEVRVMDDLSATDGRWNNLAGHKGNSRLSIHRGCAATDSRATKDNIDWSDITFHMAAVVGVQRVLDEPLRTLEVNIDCTRAVLSAAANNQKRVIIASTSEVYGKNDRVPFREDQDLVLGPPHLSRWGYAYSKLLDERLALAYGDRVQVTVARLFNTVGPRQNGRYGMVLPRFASWALKNETIRVYGDGNQTRCFTHVRDSVEALVRLARAGSAIGEIFNVGSEEETTINNLAERVRAACGSTSSLQHLAHPNPGFEEMRRRVPSLAKLRAVIGFTPSTPLGDIIEDVLDDRRRALAEEQESAPRP